MEKKLILEMIYPWWALILLGFLFMAFTGYSYTRMKKEMEPSKKGSLFFLRLLAFGFLMAFAVHPVLRRSSWKEAPRQIILLQDFSHSMDIRDCNSLSRLESSKILLQKNQSLLASLQDKFNYHYFSFGLNLNPTELEETGTALGDALREVTTRIPKNQILAILILSDGQNNSGSSPLEEARRIGKSGIPLYCFPFGKEGKKGEGYFDIQAQNILTQKKAYVGLEIPMMGEFVLRGLLGKKVRIHLKVQDKKIASKIISPASQLATERIDFTHKFPSPGMYKITLEGQPIQGEATRENNSISTFVQVQTKDLHVLYLEKYPRWELKFLRRALKEDRDMTLEMHFITGSSFRPPRGFRWDKYQAVIIGDIPPNAFWRPHLADLKEAIFNKKVGLILLGGKESFSRGGYSNTPLRAALPLTTQMAHYQPIPASPVPTAQGRNHFILRLDPAKRSSSLFWRNLPPFQGVVTGVKLKGGAQTVIQDQQRGLPLLALQPNAGLGRTAVMLSENTWPWVMGQDKGEILHQKFWSQLLLWVSHREKREKKSLWLDQDQYRFLPGQKVVIRAYVQDKAGRNISKARVLGKLLTPNGKNQEEIRFSLQQDCYQWDFFPKELGEYKIQVTALVDSKGLGPARTGFIVHQKNIEMTTIAANPALLRQMAHLSGGKSLPSSDFAKLLSSLLSKPSQIRVKVEETETALLDPQIIFLFFVILLSLEWYIRRQQGMA